VKVPDTLELLLDLMRAKGCASFEFEAAGVGGSPVKVKVTSMSGAPSVPTFTTTAPDSDLVYRTPSFSMSVVDSVMERRPSDIELALNPPQLDEAEESADPSEALAPEAPRVSAPAGAPDPDASA
jgi:hypothetical protein